MIFGILAVTNIQAHIYVSFKLYGIISTANMYMEATRVIVLYMGLLPDA